MVASALAKGSISGPQVAFILMGLILLLLVVYAYDSIKGGK